jgi:hypothetical protein
MNIILSLIYAPCVFFSLKYFDIETVSFVIFCTSVIWLLISLQSSVKEALYPVLYILVSSVTFFVEDFLILKAMPLIISIVITSLLAISYFNKTSLILYFAKKISKKQISYQEQQYIHQSTLFWIGVSGVNVLCHLFVLFHEDVLFWIFYSSIGWYGIFILAGVGQFLHKKFVFLKKVHV